MKKYNEIPELLERFMREQNEHERWVTVQELRERYGLTRYQCNTVSGFLRRLEHGSFGRFPYIVLRIEHEERLTPSGPLKCRYLVKRKETDAANPVRGMIHPTRARSQSASPV